LQGNSFCHAGNPASPVVLTVRETRTYSPHMTDRPLRYIPENDSFVIVNGTHRFNRPLYCGQTPVLVYAGDLPEFLLSLPGKGGTLALGIATTEGGKWLTACDHITARYCPGSMVYEVGDSLVRGGRIGLEILPPHGRRGFICRLTTSNRCPDFDLVLALGGASGFMAGRANLDLTGYTTEDAALFRPEDCQDNAFEIFTGGFRLQAPCHGKGFVRGTVPSRFALHLADARERDTPRRLLS
jgi:hypothetical protein